MSSLLPFIIWRKQTQAIVWVRDFFFLNQCFTTYTFFFFFGYILFSVLLICPHCSIWYLVDSEILIARLLQSGSVCHICCTFGPMPCIITANCLFYGYRISSYYDFHMHYSNVIVISPNSNRTETIVIVYLLCVLGPFLLVMCWHLKCRYIQVLTCFYMVCICSRVFSDPALANISASRISPI